MDRSNAASAFHPTPRQPLNDMEAATPVTSSQNDASTAISNGHTTVLNTHGWGRRATNRPLRETWEGLDSTHRFKLQHGGWLADTQVVFIQSDGVPERCACRYCAKAPHMACTHLTVEQREASGRWYACLETNPSAQEPPTDIFSLERFLAENTSTDCSFEDWQSEVESCDWVEHPVDSLVKAVRSAHGRSLHLLSRFEGWCGAEIISRCLLAAHDAFIKRVHNIKTPKRRPNERFTQMRPEWEKFLIDNIRQLYGEIGLKEPPPILSQDCVAGYADRLEEKLPPTMTVSDKWYFYKNGVWRNEDTDPYQPLALSLLPRDRQSARNGHEVLKTLEMRRQTDGTTLISCYRFDGEGAVIVNCANGVLRVTATSVSLLEHDARYRFTGQLTASYRPESQCDNFLAALEAALPQEGDVEAVQWWSGYFIYPSSKHRVALVCFGPTQAGKSTIFEYGIGSVFGYNPARGNKEISELFTSVSLSDICAENGYSLPSLKGAAINLGGELNPDEIAGSDRLKSLIGGEAIVVREIYGKPTRMTAYTVKLVFLANHLPRFKSGSDAELSRLRFLLFNHPPTRIDPDLKLRVAKEADGVFSQFMVPGLQMILNGSPVPEGGAESRRLRSRFAINNDPIATFVQSCCVLERGATELKSRLARAFAFYAETHDLSEKLVESRTFFKILKGRFADIEDYRPRTDGRERRVRGIRLQDGVELAEERFDQLRQI